MSAVECPPTPPTLPEGDAALTPPPKSLEKSDSDESLAKSVPQRRPSSPDHDAKCAICLGNLDNLSHTDKCYHKFCFICLKEWSKVKPECPLCKTKFKSIIHTIKSDGKSEQFDLPPPPRTEQDTASASAFCLVCNFSYSRHSFLYLACCRLTAVS